MKRKTQAIIYAIALSLAVVVVYSAYAGWAMYTFDDPVGVYVDHFRSLGNAEKITHPEYREYICTQGAKYSSWPKWAVYNPTYCRTSRKRRWKVPHKLERAYCEVGAFSSLLQLPLYAKAFEWLDRRFPQLELRETHGVEYLRWSINEIKKCREFVRSGGRINDYPSDYQALCQACDFPMSIAEDMEEVRRRIAQGCMA